MAGVGRRYVRRRWADDYLVDEQDFWQLRHDAGWFFRGSWAWFLEERYGQAYNERYAEFGVTSSGWPARRTP